MYDEEEPKSTEGERIYSKKQTLVQRNGGGMTQSDQSGLCFHFPVCLRIMTAVFWLLLGTSGPLSFALGGMKRNVYK